MATPDQSSDFTNARAEESPFGPPLVGALLRVPLEAVQQHMLDRLHASGFADFDVPYLPVFQYPGPQGMRPSDLASRLRISKQALNYLLGELERLDYLERRPDRDDQRAKRIVLTSRGIAAVGVIREAVAEIEATWSEHLAPERFATLRDLLLELNHVTGRLRT